MHNCKIEGKLRVMCRPKKLGLEEPNEARMEALAGLEVCFFLIPFEKYFHIMF